MRSTALSKRDIVLIVPRHGGGPQPSPAVLKKARLIAKRKGKRLLPPLPLPAADAVKEGEQTQPSTIEEELESSSDWNSLLLTARAQRGPQWDVASQQFMVDKGSDLYYNYTALMVLKDKDEGTRQQLQQQAASQRDMHQAQQMQQLQLPQQNIHLSDSGLGSHSTQQQYNPNSYQNPSSIVQLHQAPQQTPMMGMQGGGMGMGVFGPDVYIPPDIRTNPRRTTRAGGANGQQGMYRV